MKQYEISLEGGPVALQVQFKVQPCYGLKIPFFNLYEHNNKDQEDSRYAKYCFKTDLIKLLTLIKCLLYLS